MDLSRFQRIVSTLREANAEKDVPAITVALGDLTRATYRDYTIKSFLVEAGVIPALVAANEALPPGSSEAHSSVALCLWGLVIGHKPNKIKLVEQGALPVLISGLEGTPDEDCTQYSALAVWSLCYSVPENQLAAAASIPALKALLKHASTLVQYAAAGALWAVSSHPQNREQLILDDFLLSTLIQFLPEAAPPAETSPSLDAPSLERPRGFSFLESPPLPVANRVSTRDLGTSSVSAANTSSADEAISSRDGNPSMGLDERVQRSSPRAAVVSTLPNRFRNVVFTSSSEEGRRERMRTASVPPDTFRNVAFASPSEEARRERIESASAPPDNFGDAASASLRPRPNQTEEPPVESTAPPRAWRWSLRDDWRMATERLSENLQQQSDLLGRQTRRLRGLSGTAPSLSEAAAAVSELDTTTQERPLDPPRIEEPVSILSPVAEASEQLIADPRPSTAIEELRTLVRAERARAEAFVARAGALVDEERTIRGNLTNLERELAVAVRERDAAVAERDRTSAVLGRALEALSSARDQLAALGGSLRASNLPPRPAPVAPTEEYELLEMLDAQPEVAPPDPQQGKKACLMTCLLLGNLSLCQLSESLEVRKAFEGHKWSEAMARVLRFVKGLGASDSFWATMLWTTVQPLVDLLQSPEPAVQALSLFIVVDLCHGNEHKHKFILEGAVPHMGRLCCSPSPLVRRLARSALLQLGIRPSAASSLEASPKAESLPEAPSDISECVICCDELSTAAFEPCGHVISCIRCAQCLVARGDRCPMCREAIGSVKMDVGKG